MQSFAGDVFHYQVQALAVVPNFEDFADIRMVERGGCTCLAAQAFASLRLGGHFRRQELNGDLAIKPGIASAIHNAHATFTNVVKDFIWTQPRCGGQRTQGGSFCRVLGLGKNIRTAWIFNLVEHREHLAGDFRIGGCRVDILLPLRFGESDGGFVDRVRKLPAIVRHGPGVPAKASSSQLRAKLQWRATVAVPQPISRAISSRVRPSKTLSSTTCRSAGLIAASRFRRSSISSSECSAGECGPDRSGSSAFSVRFESGRA